MHNTFVNLRATVARSTIHARVMCAIVLVALAALVVSGAVVLALSLRASHNRVDARLRMSVEALRHLSSDPVDPLASRPPGSAEEVLRTYLRRASLSPEEGELGIVEGRLRWLAPPGRGLRPESDEALLAHLLALADNPDARITSVTTSRGRYRVLVVPVRDQSTTVAYARVVDLDLAEAESWHTMRFYALAACGALALVAGIAWFGVGHLLRPIAALRKATEAIHEQDLTSRVAVHGHDDLSMLADAVNRMLDRVQHAVQNQRQLLDDVGHELRTPITILRGHLELVDAQDPEDVTRTTTLAIDELDRMGVLVNDLLALAASRSIDSIQASPTDVEELTLQVLDKASALGDRCWRLGSCSQQTAVLDPVRTTQAWLQLVSNAVRYSEAGSVVTLGSQVDGDDVLLWVEDEGIGIPEHEIELVRQRSARSSLTRSSTGGHGLGLSIVEGIVSSHGGVLDIRSTPGQGSVFTMRLPLTGPPSTAPEAV